jgi:hypothetical protein
MPCTKSGEEKFMQTDPNGDTNGTARRRLFFFNCSVEKGVWDSGNRKTSNRTGWER